MTTPAITSKPLYKHPDAVDWYYFTLTPWLCGDAKVTSIKEIVEQDGDGELVFQKSAKINDEQVAALIGGGSDNVNYEIKVSVFTGSTTLSTNPPTAVGHVLTRVFPLRVRKR